MRKRRDLLGVDAVALAVIVDGAYRVGIRSNHCCRVELQLKEPIVRSQPPGEAVDGIPQEGEDFPAMASLDEAGS